MTTSEIIRIYKKQSSVCDGTQGWFNALSVKLERSHLIQVLKDTNHCNHITKNLDAWLELNSWSDIVSMVDCALELETDSYLNTIK